MVLQQLLYYVHYSAVERLIEKEPSLVHAKKSDGYTALHIAVINDHQDSANILILKVRQLLAFINMRRLHVHVHADGKDS